MDDWKHSHLTDKNSINWNAFFHNDNQTNFNEYSRSYVTVQKDIQDHKNGLLATIFSTPITAFR